MTSVAKVTAHPQEGFRAEAVVQQYDGSTVTGEQTVPLLAGAETQLVFYGGQQVLLREVEIPKSEEDGEGG